MKKLLVLVLALMMVLTTAAFAVPSKTTGDLTVVEVIKSETGVEVPANLVVAIPAPTKTATDELDKVVKFVAEGKKPVEYFAKENPVVEESIKALLPADVDVTTLEMNEFAPLNVENYDETIGNLTVGFKFATEYKDGAVIVAMVGVVTGVDADGNSIIEWVALPATVENGVVNVSFTAETLALVRDGDAMISILSAPEA